MIAGTESVALCHVCAKIIVICAIMGYTRYVVTAMICYGLRLPTSLTLSLLLSLWHKKEKSLVRARLKISIRGRIWGATFRHDFKAIFIHLGGKRCIDHAMKGINGHVNREIKTLGDPCKPFILPGT